jgi:hypothetical protein
MNPEYIVGEVSFGNSLAPEAEFYKDESSRQAALINELVAEVANLKRNRRVLRDALMRCAPLSTDAMEAKCEAMTATAS